MADYTPQEVGYPDELDVKNHPKLRRWSLDYREVQRVLWWLTNAVSSANCKSKRDWREVKDLCKIAKAALLVKVEPKTMRAACIMRGYKQMFKADESLAWIWLPDLRLANPDTNQVEDGETRTTTL